MARTKHKTMYTVVLHPKRGYAACGYGDPSRRKWRGNKKFFNLADALMWIDKVRETFYRRKRCWRSFQVLRYKNWDTETLLFAYFESETIYIPSLTHSVEAV
jgi:hypothetical protein